ncbi:MAG: aminotransferase class I/II-fold pyridoxal phosphate-dependent enzyme, partial [Ruminococcaceae bacterium]|nr:aminotransferase class I/II-fold pyridoxal phosphate-dependent enzyme [Oscillospiraceae bacterium]
PGHKRNSEYFPFFGSMLDCDITEIEGYDNLHCPSGILKESMEKASEVFKSDHSIYLVNGSTCGILSSITALVSQGDKVLVDRSSHKSVYNALELSGAEPVYICPEFHSEYGINSGISAKNVELALSNAPDAKLVVITSPTYEGVVSDVESIARICHSHGVPLMVDCAHGAHFGFANFPKSPTSCGADIVISSLHKTLSGLTQTAICHVRHEYYQKVMDKLSVFETSSPSYILLSSIDQCVDMLKDSNILFNWQKNLSAFYNEASSLKNLRILQNQGDFFDLDTSKITIITSDSKKLAGLLRENGIEPEMTSANYVLCMTGIGDTSQTLSALRDVLLLIDRQFSPVKKCTHLISSPRTVMPVSTAKSQPSEYVDEISAAGRISAEYLWAYPPGIPILTPGELITHKELEILKSYTSCGIELSGTSTYKSGKILVLST